MSCSKNILDGPYLRDFVENQYQGDSISFEGRFEEEDGTAIDISDDAFFLLIENMRGVEKLSLSIGDGIELPDDGEWAVHITSAQTTDLPVNEPLPYFLRWVRGSDGFAKIIQAGKIALTPNRTPTS